MSGGYTPSVHLFSQSRGKLEWNEALQAFLPGSPRERERSAGACRGIFDLAAVLADGAAAGTAAAREALDPARRGVNPGAGTRTVAAPPAPAATRAAGAVGALRRHARARNAGQAFVDWQHDVTLKDLALATREGFHSIEHVKRYTTTGMATDQGKTSNFNALAIVAQPARQADPASRADHVPHAVHAGQLRQLRRHLARRSVRSGAHHADACLGAGARARCSRDVGLWKRARYFPRGGEDMHAAVARECLAVRSGCGIFDASTLGKIEVVGADAAEFMNRLYVNTWADLGVGRCRYGILLREDGFIYDDGVVARVPAHRFHVTTTTGGAPRVLAMMEDYRQTEWPELKVWLTSTTEQWAVIAVQGPKAREVLGAARRTSISARPRCRT